MDSLTVTKMESHWLRNKCVTRCLGFISTKKVDSAYGAIIED